MVFFSGQLFPMKTFTQEKCFSSPWSWVQSPSEITYEIVSPHLSLYQHGLALKKHIWFSMIPQWLWLILERNCVCGQPSACVATTSLGFCISKFLLDVSPMLTYVYCDQYREAGLHWLQSCAGLRAYSGCIKWEMIGGWRISNEFIPPLQLLCTITSILFLQKRNPTFFKLLMWTPACGWIQYIRAWSYIPGVWHPLQYPYSTHLF